MNIAAHATAKELRAIADLIDGLQEAAKGTLSSYKTINVSYAPMKVRDNEGKVLGTVCRYRLFGWDPYEFVFKAA